MKKFTLMMGSLLLAVSMVFVSCKSDDPEPTPDPTVIPEATINDFFTVEGANLIQAIMPTATSDEAIQVSMNENIIPGGSSWVTLVSEVAARKILVGLKGEVGYYELVPQVSRDYEYNFTVMINQNIALPEEGMTIQVAIMDENGEISQVWETTVELLVVGTGALQVSLSFDNAKDVDLHLIEPEYIDEYGYEASFYSRHIYYGNRVSDNGGELDLDSNASCWLDYVNNENITYNDSLAWVAPGTYKVYVDLWENCDPTVATNYVVVVSFGGTVIASKAGVFQVDAPSTFNPIDEYYVEENEPFLSFTIGDRGQKKVKSFEPAPMTQSAIEKEAGSVHK